MSVTYAVPAGLRRLDPEPWGSRLTRARESSRLTPTLKKAALWISRTTRPLSEASISRLEARTTVPLDSSRRRTAFLLCLLYEVDPTDLDLGPDDGPDELEVKRLHNAVSAMITLGELGRVLPLPIVNRLVAA